MLWLIRGYTVPFYVLGRAQAQPLKLLIHALLDDNEHNDILKDTFKGCDITFIAEVTT